MNIVKIYEQKPYNIGGDGGYNVVISDKGLASFLFVLEQSEDIKSYSVDNDSFIHSSAMVGALTKIIT
jgi:hypothetical protein